MKAHPDLATYTDPTVRAAAEAVVQGEPDVQELVWARDVLLRMIPQPVTAGNPPHAGDYQPSREKPCGRCNGERRDRDGNPYPKLYSSYGQRKRWVGYCTACARDAELARQRARRRARRTDLTCEHCGTVFTPPRSDGRYCSPACRQKAYRRRKDGVT
jgi:hypothetical protein